MHKKKLWWGKTGEYTPLKYLEGTGTGTYTSGQYIDTGLDYFADFEITVKQRESAGMKALATTTYYCIERENATTNAWRFRNGESTFFTTSLLVTDLHTLKWKGGKVYGDGVELGSFAKTSNTGRMYLFAGSTPTDATRINRYPLQISSCRMWNPSTGELVRDYIPVLDKNGTPCMLDRVENKLYYNQGDGDFLYEEWDYTPVDYLESTGTQYIDTGVEYNENTGLDIKFAFVDQEITSAKHLIGGQVQGSNPSRYNPLYCTVVDGVYKIRTLLNIAGTSSITRNFDTNIHVLQFNIYPNKKVIYDGVDEGTVESVGIGNNIDLFRRNLAAGYGYCSGKIYYCKIWNGTALVRDYVPVVDGNNVGCLYDRTLNTLFYSSGSSDFVGHFIENGVDYKVVKNIIAEQVATSTNTRDCPYIKTGVIPGYNKKTRMVAKFAYAHTDTTYEYFCGMNYGGRFIFGHAGTNNKVYFGLGAKNYTSDYVMDTDVHLYKLDWATAKAGIDDNEYTLSSAGQYDQAGDFWINGRHATNYANVNRPMGGTSYWWKFWEGKKLVYNGIPAVRVSDNKVGLFETINRQFQTTAGTVEYTYTE